MQQSNAIIMAVMHIPQDVIVNNILAFNPTPFLRVSKAYNQRALQEIINSNIFDNNFLLCNYVRHHNINAVRAILKNPQSNPSANYNAALEVGFIRNNIEAVKLIIEHPQFTHEPIRIECQLYSIVSAAAMLNRPKILSSLLSYKEFDPSEEFNLHIRLAASENHSEVVKVLLSDPRVSLHIPKNEYGEPVIDGVEPLPCACSWGNTELVKCYLMDDRIQYSNIGEALVKAAYFGLADIVKILLDDNRIQNIEHYGAEALSDASLRGNNEVMRHLLDDKRIDPNYEEGKALLNACYSAPKTTIQLLLSDERTIVTDRVMNTIVSLDRNGDIALLLVQHRNKKNF